MAFELTAKTRSILNQIEKRPSVLLDVEGIDLILSSSFTLKLGRWDDSLTWDQEGLRWDSGVENTDIKSFINLKQSTRSISQQIYPDKKGASSITSVQITIIDKDMRVSKAFALNTITEILGKKCTFNLGFQGGVYPQDYMPIMNGIITDYSYQGGNVVISISHADTLRRQAILTTYNSQLTSGIDASVTTIPVQTTNKFLPSLDALTSYIKIGDERMEVTAVSATEFTVIRGSNPTTHDSDAEVTSFYRLQGLPLTLAQKIMQSDGKQSFFASDIPIVSFEYVSISESINDAIIFDSYNVQRETGLISGDLIKIGATTYTAQSFGITSNNRSFIIVEETLTEDKEPAITSWSFCSQYNVLNFGLGMFPFEVDNEAFEDIKRLFSPNFIEMDFPLSDGISNARDFINEQLYFVAGCYGIPRNARSSVKFLSPPLTIEQLPSLNETNINNMVDLRPQRSTEKFYYNDILFSFNKSFVDGEYKSFTQTLNTDSLNRFSVGNKQLAIESDGYIRSTATDQILDRLAGRFLDRYKLASTYIPGLRTSFKTGFDMQVGDVVFFGGSSTKLVDFNTGLRKLPLEKYEIINQKINLEGEIELDLLATGFALNQTYGVFSPAAQVVSGTTTKLRIEEIGNLEEFTNPQDRFVDFVGKKIRVRSEDYSFDETVTLLSLDTQDSSAIIITALSSAPSAGFVVEPALYSDYTDELVPLKYTFTMNQDEITAVTSTSVFTVTSGADFFVGQRIAVHSDDYARDALDVTIDSIAGNIITLTEALSFTPVIGDKIETLEFSDRDAYAFL